LKQNAVDMQKEFTSNEAIALNRMTARQAISDICLSDEVRRVRAEIQSRKKSAGPERVRPVRRARSA
jgi:hypothetical protein